MGKVFFLKTRQMLAKFKEITDADPPMAKEEGFYNFLAGFAGKETNEKHLVYIVTLALQYSARQYPINLSKHIGAMVDDANTIQKARKLLEGAAVRLKEKNSTGQIILF